MLSLTSHYALRAMVHLAKHSEEWPITGAVIAEEAGIPAKYLSKILGDLVRAGILESTRGKSGGFRMTLSPKKTMLVDVLAPFEQLDRRRCPFENLACDSEDTCLAHDRWMKVVDARSRFLEHTSVYDVALKPRRRR